MSLTHALGRFVGSGAAPRIPVAERCHLCSAPIDDAHRHLVDLQARSLLCACRACGLLFADRGTVSGRYRAVPDRVLVDPAFALPVEQWAALGIPVGLAFLFENSTLGQWVTCYPSPGGAMESEVPAEAWRALVAASPLLRAVQPDVEALLVHPGGGRRRGGELECFLAPIDACYQLVALVRQRWKGFDGGDDAWTAIEAFFSSLRSRSRPLDERRDLTAAGGPP